MSLKFPFRKPFSKQLVVAIFESDRVISNLGRNVNRRVQMLQAVTVEKFEFERLTQDLI
jgi:hypothetical protein